MFQFSRLLSFVCAIIAIATAKVCATAAEAEQPPHLFVYLSDDHSWFDTSLHGAEDIPTPEMEQLAADGMTFTRAFVASPACAPSRAAMLTGLMPARNGAEANHTYPEPGTPSLIESLKSAGYLTAAFGKVAHGAESAAEMGFDHVSGSRKHPDMKRGVIAFLDNRPENQPVAIFVGTSNPHVPWPKKHEIDPTSLVLPPIHLDTPKTRSHRATYVQEIIDLDALLGQLRKIADEHLGQDTVFLHSSDHGSQWPFGKWNLYDYGIRVPFFVSWPGRIAAGSRSDAMISWIDLLPTLLDIAGGEIPGEIDGRSFLPVLLGERDTHRERIFTTHTGDGDKNIYPIRSVRTGEWKLIHNLRPDLAHTNHSDLLRKRGAGAYWHDWAARAKTDPAAKAVVDRYFARPEFELYHVSRDPWEQRNLIDDPAQSERIAKLKAELAAWRKAQGDRGEIFDTPRPLDQPRTWHPDFFGNHEVLGQVPEDSEGR